MRIRKFVWAAGIFLCAGVLLFSSVQIFLPLRDYSTAGKEYAALRRQYASGATPSGNTTDATAPSSLDLSGVNPDYIGWIQIPGTAIDYPIARGQDNAKYLHTTFSGEENPVGSIFMDCGVANGFDACHVVLYGHNVRDGNMFGGLYHYLDRDYLEQNQTVVVTTVMGDTLTYTIFSARKTNVRDTVYRVDFPTAAAFAELAQSLGAPEDTKYLLTLSTCTNDGGRDERVVVHALRV